MVIYVYMEKSTDLGQFDLTYEEALLQKEQLEAVREAAVITQTAKHGEQPLSEIPIIDALKHMGSCPCLQCFRDEFIS